MQKTIKNKIEISGKGLHSGIKTTAIFLPAEINTGIRFRRIDLKDKPFIEATVENVSETNRRTVLTKKNVIVETVEHVLAAVVSLSITNIIIELNGPEVPILDGGASMLITTLEIAGIKNQFERRKSIKIEHYFKVAVEDSIIEFFPNKELEIHVKIDYDSNILKAQTASIKTLKNFKKDIAGARTFCFLHELNQLIEHNLIKGGDENNGLVFVEEDTSIDDLGAVKKIISNKSDIIKKGILNNKELLWENEQAKHKLLDLVGDLGLAGGDVKGKIVATKPGHKINVLFTKKLLSQVNKNKDIMKTKPLMKIDDIKKILPHREPFLFIDEIRELEDNQVTGVKYVNSNEYYFEGHFPGAPVMPGVLQIEAMAQTGGILALNSVPDPENYLTYFMKIDNVKFKQKVEPNCTLIFKLQLLSPIRRGICHMQGRAYVNNELVTEAELMAKIVKEKE